MSSAALLLKNRWLYPLPLRQGPPFVVADLLTALAQNLAILAYI